MTHQTPQHPRKVARSLAGRQHDVIERGQLLGLGFGPEWIKHRVATGRLHPMFRGVYAVGRPNVGQLGWWMAAVLSCGPHAALSHGSAAALWGILPVAAGEIHVSVPTDRRRPGIVVHRRPLPATELARRRNIPVTGPVRTLIDLAADLDRDDLEHAINAADKLGLVSPERLRRELESRPGSTGVPHLRRTLDIRTFTMTDTQLERRLLPIVRRVGLPLPKTQVYVNGFRVDFYWPDLGLVVETDGLTYHRTPAEQARDRLRDQVHTAAGLTVLRFTRAQVRFEPRHVETILAAVARRLSDPLASARAGRSARAPRPPAGGPGRGARR
jgi:very-short-patch-repair endonuclease